jgi:uncharacterized protein YkwD
VQEKNDMKRINRWTTGLAGLAMAWSLVACGGGGSGSAAVAPAPTPIPTPPPPVIAGPEAGAPAPVGNVAIDGRNWINFRRTQIGIPVMTQNGMIDSAALSHSEYQKLNDVVSHEEIAGNPGFTGVDLLARLTTAGYRFNANNNYAYGEVISATSNNSGAYMVDELITAIYHRFVIFEPMFKELGTGSATTAKGYTYLTSDFASNNGYGPGIGRGAVVIWPYNGQVGVTPNFFSDNEAPDPVAGVNEVGYPVSVHADITATLTVQSFTLRPRGGAVLPVKLLKLDVDAHTPKSAAAIVPLIVLQPATVYDVAFTGTADTVPVSKNWSFTTK